MLFARKQAFQL
jgi:arginine kinase